VGHVFISYAREDRGKVATLASALEQRGVSVWLDDRLPTGSEFDTAIEDALAEATKVVVVWSPASAASRWVRAEAGEGLERRILVPLLIEQCRIPLEFRRIQTLDFTKWDAAPESAELHDLMGALTGGTTAATHDRPSRSTIPESSQRPDITAEVVTANKYLGRFRILVRVGSETHDIVHTDFMFFQKVRLNGTLVSSFSWTPVNHYHQFPIHARVGDHNAELTVMGDSMTLHGLVLRIDGHEVLRRKLSWTDGLLVSVLFLGVPLAALYYYLFLMP